MRDVAQALQPDDLALAEAAFGAEAVGARLLERRRQEQDRHRVSPAFAAAAAEVAEQGRIIASNLRPAVRPLRDAVAAQLAEMRAMLGRNSGSKEIDTHAFS